ncbi:MAG: hypothetical protein CMH48_09015 [Muricauda sp.]|nr:DUF4136 domain-containing protein [Allomuricauda sp.]MAU26371.1 hypothetical protein [Allomuricauda sp.]MBC30974.1 hypothetical protein [Allomuricauda sp.]|tara:strand:+ start:26880 stop:27401 length:522 start_codon:yes stop_codon:yes gene_type:complete
MKKLFCLIAVLALFSCAGGRVTYDYDKATDFSNYSTYNYFDDMETGLSQLDERRLLKILDSTLQAKGFLLSEEPDFLVNIISSEYRKAPSNTVGVGVGGAGRNVGGGISVGVPLGSSALERRIQFDFVDFQKNTLFWQAVSESGYNDEASPYEREEKLRAIVNKVFSKFPPKN